MLQRLEESAPGDRTPRLRIAMIAPPWFELPPRGYGGIESVVADLVDALSERGHHITLIGAGNHRTKAAHFAATFDRPPSERLGTPVPEVLHAAAAAEILEDLDVDLVHDHTLAGPLLASARAVPTLATMHGPVTGGMGSYFERLGRQVDVVAISDAQRRLNPRINWAGTVHNAIDVSSYPYRAKKEEFVLWMGRFCDEKGADLAIDAACEASMKIVLAGKCNESAEKRYFEARIAPRLGPGVEYIGEADATMKRRLAAAARALLFPIQWEEPFGMVMIEAMACGTPVVAFGRGSVPEIVVHERTGFIAHGPAELPGALRAVEDLDPQTIREYARENFNLNVMAAGYERVYADLVGQHHVRREEMSVA
jgi:glycosyltransferase involved in cell wall biosynthesis